MDRYAALIADFDIDTYLRHLDECGWLALLTNAQQQAMRQRLNEIMAWDIKYVYLALATYDRDSESIYGLGPDQASYWNWITELAAVSRGVFQPADVLDEFVHDEAGERIAYRVSFRVGERLYQHETEDLSDWFDMGVLDLINQAIRESGTRLQFEQLPLHDQTLQLIFVPDAIYRCAVRRGLVPPPAYWYPADHHLREPLCEWFYELVEQTPPDVSVLEVYRKQESQWMNDNWHRYPASGS